jgi:polysaccharide pyruvyl transferase WcaK-like protein
MIDESSHSGPWFVPDREHETVNRSRPHAHTLFAKRRHLHLLLPSRRRVAYIGCTKTQNAGDDAVAAVHHRAFPMCRLVEVPTGRTLSLIEAFAPQEGVVRSVMLGGGTLIGKPQYLYPISQLSKRHTALPMFMLGTGVEDPSFYGGARPDGAAELARWRDVLPKFGRICVRGPLSQQILNSIDIKSEVTGDPALLLGDPAPSTEFSERSLGINLGISRRIWGGDPERLLDEVAAFVSTMTSQGWSVTFFPMWREDISYIEEAMRRSRGDVRFFANFDDIDSLLAGIRNCHVFVGLKLHSVVFATATYVPAVMLEYQPKCRDFQESIGRAAFTLRTDQVSRNALLELTEDLAERREKHQAALAAGISVCRTRLWTQIRHIRGELRGLGMPQGATQRSLVRNS